MTSTPQPGSGPSARRRVAVVSDFTLATLGGAEAAYREQVKALAGEYDVLALCPGSDELADLGRLDHVTAVGLPVIFRVPGLGFPVTRNNARLRAAIDTALTEFPVDVIHLHSEFGIGAATHQVAANRGIPVVQTVHCWLQTHWPIQPLLAAGAPLFHRWATGLTQPGRRFADRRGDSALRAMTVAVAEHATRIVSPSSHLAEDLAAAGLGPIDVIPNAQAVPPSGEPLTTIEGPLRVFWFGRCVGEKRLLPFVESALAAIEEVGPGRLRIDIAGDGEHLARARALAAGVDDIVLHGRLDHRQILDELSRCHVTALTSVGFDNQPMMVVESVSALRGVIHTDPRLREGLDSGAGLLAAGEPSVLTELLVRLARDPAPVIAASRAAVDAREEFSATTFVRRADATYTAAVTAEPATVIPLDRPPGRSSTTVDDDTGDSTAHQPTNRLEESDTGSATDNTVTNHPVDRIVPEGAER